jgi:tetratricopeptide (TPR) repeat protein
MNPCRLTPLLLLLFPLNVFAADPIPWFTDYVAARKEAEAKNRPMLVVIGSQDCFYCRKMEAGTFADPNVVTLVNAKFVALKVDASANPEFARSMRVSVYPTTILAGSDGKIHGFFGGYLSVDQFKENAGKSLASIPPAAPPAAVAQIAPLPPQVPAVTIPIAPSAPLAKSNAPSARELLALAKEAQQADRYGESLERCEQLLALYEDEPETKPALNLLRSIQSSPEKLAKAAEQIDERNASSYFALAEAFQTQGKYREAMASYEKAMKVAPLSKTAEAAHLKVATLIRNHPDLR